MKLRLKILFPSIFILLLLCGVAGIQYYLTETHLTETRKMEALENKLRDTGDILADKIDEHFQKALALLTQLETEKAHSDIQAQQDQITQIELNTISFLETFSILLKELKAPLVSPVDESEIHDLERKIKSNFATVKLALRFMPNDEDRGDTYLMSSARQSNEISTQLRQMSYRVQTSLHHTIKTHHNDLDSLLHRVWWLAFGAVFILSIGFVIYSRHLSHTIQTVVNKFEQLFPESTIGDAIQDVQQGIGQLEWLAENLKETRQKLQTSQSNLDTLISQSSSGIYVHRHMKPLFANKALVDLCGLDTPEDLIRLGSTTEILPPHERERVISFHEARLRGEHAPSLYELEILRQDGTTRTVLNKSFAIDWDGEKAICTTLIDVTDRKQAEQQLHDSEDRFQELLELTPDPIFIYTVDGTILDANAAASKSLGFSRDEFLTMNFAEIEPRNQDRQSQFFWKTDDQSGSLFKSIQTYHVRKDGSRFPVEVNITSGIFDSQPVILAIAHDMTQTVEQIKELDTLRQQAEEASRAKSEFLSMMSHELRTPLNSIIGYSDLFLQNSRKKDPVPKEAKWIELVKVSGQELLEIIDKVLDLIAVDNESEHHTASSSDIIEQVNSALESLQNGIEKKNITIEKKFNINTTAYANASSKAAYIICENLLSNAVKYNQDGGTITLDLEDDGAGYYRLSIEDTGCGIKPENIKQAFEPFNRLGHENGPIAGNGIGLTLVQKIADYIGARIQISSSEGNGCRVVAILPKGLVI